jgi:flagellar protein FlaG
MKIAPTSIGSIAQAEQAATRPALKPARGAEQAARAEAYRQASDPRRAEQAEKRDPTPQTNEKVLEQLQEQAGKALSHFGHSVRIRSHGPGRVVMQVVDKDSGELIRQFPDEDALALADRLEDMRGLLFSGEG